MKKIVCILLLVFAVCAGVWGQSPEIPEFTRNRRLIKPVQGQDKITIDWQTTENIDEKVTCTFSSSPAVRFMNGDIDLVRLDGLWDSTRENNILSMGNFYYSALETDQDIIIELFKHKLPREANHAGLIYLITHKGVSYLLFGDFDDADGIENLLEVSAANQGRRASIARSADMQNVKQVIAVSSAVGKSVNIVRRNYMYVCPRCGRYHVKNWEIIKGLLDTTDMLLQLQRDYAAVQREIDKLDEELATLPVLNADVIKWPHDAHVFENSEKTDAIIRRLNEVVNPRFIIWQTHSAQDAYEFEEYIKRFDFHDKFIRSDEIDIEFISLLDLLNARGMS